MQSLTFYYNFTFLVLKVKCIFAERLHLSIFWDLLLLLLCFNNFVFLNQVLISLTHANILFICKLLNIFLILQASIFVVKPLLNSFVLMINYWSVQTDVSFWFRFCCLWFRLKSRFFTVNLNCSQIILVKSTKDESHSPLRPDVWCDEWETNVVIQEINKQIHRRTLKIY